MATAARRQDRPLMTIAEFEAFLDGVGDDRHLYDLIDGEIVLMTNPSNRHEVIVSHIGDKLSAAMNRRGCETFRGNTRLQPSDDRTEGTRVRPDIVVRCGEKTREHYAKNYITDPTVIVEVLSPSTEQYDTLKKVPFYLSLPSCRHVVVVHQDEHRIEHWHRSDPEAPWARTLLPRDGGTLTLATLDFSITLDEVYGDVPLGNL